MGRLSLVALLAVSVNAQDNLSLAAKNPYDLARYIETHDRIDWNELWKAAGAKETSHGPNCGNGYFPKCTVDAITVLEPSQVILVIDSPPTSAFVRFFQDGGDWRYAGTYYNLKKNYGRRYEVDRSGEKPFLRVSSQGIGGSNIDSEVEQWFDLSSPDFDPVFEFTVKGSEYRGGIGVSRTVRSVATLESRSIMVAVDIHYQLSAEIGSANYLATYSRAADRRKFTLARVETQSSPILSNRDFEDLVNFTENAPTNEQLLTFSLPFLRQIAAGPEGDARDWLRSILSFAKDTPEKRLLQSLLVQTK